MPHLTTKHGLLYSLKQTLMAILLLKMTPAQADIETDTDGDTTEDELKTDTDTTPEDTEG